MPRPAPRPHARPARRLRATVVAALMASALALVGFAPPTGSDVMVTDAGGGRFIGVGRVDGEGLALEFSERVDELRLLLVRPDGTSQLWRGRLSDGRLLLVNDEGDEIDVADALAREDRQLRLAWPDDATVVPAHDTTEPAEDGPGDEAAGDGEPNGGEPNGDEDPPRGGPPVSVPPVDEVPLPDPPVGPPPDLQVDPPGLDDATP